MKKDLIVLSSIFALLINSAIAYDGSQNVDGVTWYYDRISDGNGGRSVSIVRNKDLKSASSYSGELTIPSKLGDYAVTAIGGEAFLFCDGLKSVIIPAGVTTIGNSAFSMCRGLTSVTIPSSVKKIDNGAFSSCEALTSVVIPSGITIIGARAFSGCKALTSVVLPSGITTIGEGAFRYCDALTVVSIPDSVTSIGREAFDDNSVKVIRIGKALSLLKTSGFYIHNDDRFRDGHVFLSLTSSLPTSPLVIKQKSIEVPLAHKWRRYNKPIGKDLNKLFGMSFGAKKKNEGKSFYNIGDIPVYAYVPEKRFLTFDEYSVMYDLNDEVFFIRAMVKCANLDELVHQETKTVQAIEQKFGVQMQKHGIVESYADITKFSRDVVFQNQKELIVCRNRSDDGKYWLTVVGVDQVVWDAVCEVRRQTPDVDDAL